MAPVQVPSRIKNSTDIFRYFSKIFNTGLPPRLMLSLLQPPVCFTLLCSYCEAVIYADIFIPFMCTENCRHFQFFSSVNSSSLRHAGLTNSPRRRTVPLSNCLQHATANLVQGFMSHRKCNIMLRRTINLERIVKYCSNRLHTSNPSPLS